MSKQEHHEERVEGLSRRGFITGAAVGAVALTSLVKNEANAQTTAAAASAAGAAEATAKKGQPLKLEEVLKVAREKLYPRCRVCPECNGDACAGEVPGFGGIGSGKAFRNNYDGLARIQFKMRTFHDVKKPDTTISLWGQDLSLPIFAACTGGTTYNMGLTGKMSEDEFIEAMLFGCKAANTVCFVADGIGDPLTVYETRLKAIARSQAKAIAIIKPRTQEEIIKRVRLVEASGAIAFGIDIDSAGRAARALPGQTVEPKTLAQLKEIAASSKLPFIVKGVMTVDEAEMAKAAGAAAIVVSNHGGRVLDHTPATVDVLAPIAAKLKGKITIFVDGGIRYGTDALKCLALGADAVLVGRPFVRGAVGGGPEGVTLMVNKMKNELVDAMVLTGVPNLKKATRKILV
ncbi:alpha-hydroxy-acid oxidizing protein [Propionivibrio dicarboxylicus]|uniref:Tat (Twin-arginine translocation) pathway signal sequence n=1 Tax=Propionivibrio dicarboxylicus TaxID=83767 RepID=A0A1G8N7V8_9RHOO|nr:alpha-hydroxy-acid oxidizing protein [Propionivibrio dicarboxylicus]SDI75660.1 Tat (twin-arginine translocation) pathway signal sequence [Propionivibrio dicarboxylicus]